MRSENMSVVPLWRYSTAAQRSGNAVLLPRRRALIVARFLFVATTFGCHCCYAASLRRLNPGKSLPSVKRTTEDFTRNFRDDISIIGSSMTAESPANNVWLMNSRSAAPDEIANTTTAVVTATHRDDLLGDDPCGLKSRQQERTRGRMQTGPSFAMNNNDKNERGDDDYDCEQELLLPPGLLSILICASCTIIRYDLPTSSSFHALLPSCKLPPVLMYVITSVAYTYI